MRRVATEMAVGEADADAKVCFLADVAPKYTLHL